MSARGTLPTTSNSPTATEQISTGACDTLGEPASVSTAGDLGLACLRGRP